MQEYDLTRQKGKAKFIEDQTPVGNELTNLHIWMHEHPNEITGWHVNRYKFLKKQHDSLTNIHKKLFTRSKK